MTRSDERIPTWIGRAVSTEDLTPDSADETVGDRPLAENSVGRPPSVDTSLADPVSDEGHARSRTDGLPKVAGLLLGIVASLLLLVLFASMFRSLNGRSVEVQEAESATGQQADESATTEASGDAREALTVDGAETTPAAPKATKDAPALEPHLVKAYGERAAAEGESAWGLYRDATIYLQGEVPSQELADSLLAETASFVPDFITVQENYVVNPDADAPVDPPLFLRESVRFEEGSSKPLEVSERVLGAFAVATLFPAAELTVVSYAEQSGDTTLAEERAKVVMDRWEQFGIDPSRVSTTIRSAEEGELVGVEGVEFVIRNLLS